MGAVTPIKYADLTDQQIKNIKKKVENQAKVDEWFDKFCEHEKWQEGHSKLQYRKLIYPKIKSSDVVASTEGVAPRPTKIAYATFECSVNNYRDKVVYTDESKKYSFDDVVGDAGRVLSYKFTQKLDYIKGTPFINSKATLTAVQVSSVDNVIATLRKAKLILQKNKAKTWAGGNYLCITTPEVIEKLRDELESNGSSLDEGTKVDLMNGLQLPAKKGFIFAECPSDLLDYSETQHYMIFMGRTIEGKSPIVVRTMNPVEIINNPLGSGVLTDDDGNYTSDDNKQIGSVAINVLGLGATITDDLCVIDCKMTVTETIKETPLQLSSNGLTNFVSASPRYATVTKTEGTNTSIALDGTTTVSGSIKAVPNTIIKAVVTAGAGKTLPSTDKWVEADFVGCTIVGGTKDDATIYVRVNEGVSAVTIKSCTIS